MTTVTLTEYKNFGKCVCISDGTVEALITVDIGPRVIRCGFVGGENIMFNDVNREVVTRDPSFAQHYYDGAEWNIYGGHRMWVSPEKLPDTYYPDDKAVDYEILSNGAVFKQEAQNENGIQQTLTVTLENGEFAVTQTITNISNENKRLSCWALTVLDAGGVEIIPQNTLPTGLLPNRRVILWPYSDMTDERIYFGSKYITLKHLPTATKAFKVGLDNLSGIAMYANKDTVFVNRCEYKTDAEYDDFGSSFETYASDKICEMEMLSPVAYLNPGEHTSITEHWQLFKNSGTPDPRDEDAIDAFVKQYI